MLFKVLKNLEESTIDKLNYTKSHFPKANRKWTAKDREKQVISKFLRRENTSSGFKPSNRFSKDDGYQSKDKDDTIMTQNA